MIAEDRVLRRVLIEDYMEKVVLSKARKAKYYNAKSELPKKYQSALDKDLAYWGKKGYLCEKDTGDRIIANPRVAGTERAIKINGQRSYSGINHHLRSKIVREMRSWYKGHLAHVPPIDRKEYPIGVGINFYKPLEAGNYDLDNMKYFYLKTLQDSLVDCKIIDDDNVKYINSLTTEYHESEEKKLEIILYKN